MNATGARLRGLFLPGFLAAVGCAVLLGLGFWQLERRIWKEELIARVEVRTRAPEASLPAESDWHKVTADRDEYRRVRANGRFRHEREALVFTTLSGRKGRASGPGYFVLTPLEHADGSIVIVNRGFVPNERRDPATRREGQIAGAVTVTGLLRMPEAAIWVTPRNEPARGLFFVRDPQAIAAAYGLARTAPFTIDADTTPNPGGLPQGGDTRLEFPANHLQYAMTWFGLAAALFGVFTVFAWQRLKEGG